MAENAYVRAAKKRWGQHYFVSGDGPIAVVNRPLNSVVLFPFELLALAYIENHPNGKELEMYRLTPDGAKTPRNEPLRVTADTYERDRR